MTVPAITCNHCGACCRDHRVPVTDADIERLRGGGEPIDAVVEWLSPVEIDMEGEPETFLRLAEGRRLLVLAHRVTEEGSSCTFHEVGTGCTVHARRPAACRTYPYELDERTHLPLALHPDTRCPEETRTNDAVDVAMRRSEFSDRREELERFVDRVATWNRRQRRRELGGRRPEGRQACLSFLRPRG